MALSKLSPIELKRVSDIVTTQLDLNGKTLREADIVMSYATLDENILCYKYAMQVYFTGSLGEASFLPGSDQDLMIVAPDIAVQFNSDRHDFSENYHLFQTIETLPGYAKLALVKLNDTDPAFSNVLETGSEDVNYLSSEKYVNYFMDTMSKKMTLQSDLRFFRNGPCASFVHLITDKEGNQIGADADIAYAVRCTIWPQNVTKRFNNKNLLQWLSYASKEKMKKMDCHYVASGRPASDTSSTEWRLSFVLVEREMLRNLSDKQFKCFILLKMLKKSYLESISKNELSSFHIKTVLFWHLEEKQKMWWEETTLIECVLSVVERLMESVERKCLPHYILPENNLFHHKFEDKNSRMEFLSNLQSLRTNIAPIIQHPFMGGLCDLWTHYSKTVFLEIAESSIANQNVRENVSCEQSLITILYGAACYRRIIDVLLPDNLVKAFQEEIMMDTLDKAFTNRLDKYICILKGMEQHEATTKETTECLKKYHMGLAKEYFEKGADADALAGQVYLANFLYMSGDFAAAKDRLLVALSRPIGILYYGVCSKHLFIKTSPMLSVMIMKKEPAESVHPRKRNATGDMIISNKFAICVPEIVQAECLNDKYGVVAVHPLIYAYLLFVLIYDAIGDLRQRAEAIHDLENVVPLTKGAQESHRVMNILGKCYQLAGENSKALRLFQESASQFPDRNNAAFYYIGSEVVKQFAAQNV